MPGGSSPRARGTPAVLFARTRLTRFIPAGAGNAPANASRRHGRTVHPRGRGERALDRAHDDLDGGSSPRARGTPLAPWGVEFGGRFIPAGAGNAASAAKRYSRMAVHPRGRGERSRLCGSSVEPNGSSPRARGTPPQELRRVYERRFIPAGAGNACSDLPRRAFMSVHPRGRGERPNAAGAGMANGGSSPRARGTLPPGR